MSTASPLVSRVRAAVRADELWLIGLTSVIGAISGGAVVAVSTAANVLHQFLFGLDAGTRLSATTVLPLGRTLAITVTGGLLAGLFGWGLRHFRARPVVDPVEANALLGGRMPLVDGVLVNLHNLISNGAGASVGLEAGYTALCSAIASHIGRAFRLRRSDLRIVLGCGAAGAIAAAFNAPLAGAFYAFELIIGSYSIPALAPVAASAVAATLTARALGSEPLLVLPVHGQVLTATDYAVVVILALVCALTGILLMWAATLTERVIHRTRLPRLLHPALGGLLVGAAGAHLPQVLSSGHGALALVIHGGFPIAALAAVLCTKIAASSISIGSGFRGGLFFSSLMIGGVLGRLTSLAAPLFLPTGTAADSFIVAGMAAMVVAVIDGPLTMTFLALEVTRDFSVTVAVMVAVLISAVIVRRLFGYSFTTWRFHQRGETIRSAHDVGWLRALTVGRMVRADAPTAPATMTIGDFRARFPLGGTQRVILVTADLCYAGLVTVADAHSTQGDENIGIESLASLKTTWLLPGQTIRQAIAAFDRAEADAIAVIARDGGPVLGLLTEAHALKRYSAELDKRQREALGLGSSE